MLDVTTSIAGPYCAQILAALGADVIKVERPDTGDDGRAWGPPFWNGEGTMFLSANAGKRSLALSLRDPRGREALLRLADGADVFLQSLRPGLADELGLGADALRARNPRLVYCSVGAYGHVGPLAHEPGYDALMQAAGGLISMTGEPGRPGVRVGSSLIDQGTGTWAALGVLAALLERERTGEGSVVDVSLYETALGYIGYHLAGYLADGTVPHGEGTRFPMVAPYQVFPTRDGELMIAGGNDRLFAAICGVSGCPSSSTTRASATNPDRVAQPRRALCDSSSSALVERRHRALAGAPDGRRRPGGAGRRRRRRRAARRRPRRSGSSSRSPTRRSPTSGSPRCRCRFDGERALHRSARRPPSASTRPRCSREAGYDDDEIAALAARGSDHGMSHVSASFSATIRVRLADAPGRVRAAREAIGEAGGSLGAIDLVRVERGTKVRDVTVDASDAEHLDADRRARPRGRRRRGRARLRPHVPHAPRRQDRDAVRRSPLKTRDDLSMAYTPGVARICQAIADDRDSAWNLTIKQNTVAVVTDGTAVLGLGDIGPGGGDARDGGQGAAVQGVRRRRRVADLPRRRRTRTRSSRSCKAIAPGFGGINLEDISAPRCFEIEERLRAELDIPVFHDDQHGTAIVVARRAAERARASSASGSRTSRS